MSLLRGLLEASDWQAPAAAPIVIAMRKLIRIARTELEDVTASLRTDVERLKALYASLPVSPQEEAMLEGEVKADFATEARAIIECVICDRLEPAIGALAEITETPRKRERGKRAASKRR